MTTIRTFQIAELLFVAQERLIYCKTITKYPKNNGMKNFDTSSSTLDSFYKNTCNAFFHDSLLITASLLTKDKRVISFYNWLLPDTKQKELDQIAIQFESSGLKGVRDQVVSHVDVGNHNNTFPLNRRQGVIAEELIIKLDDIQSKLVSLFHDYTRGQGDPHASFDLSDAQHEIDSALAIAKPTLTNNFVI